MKFFAVILSLLLFQSAFCAEFGQYQYQNFVAIQQQIQNQRALAIRRARMYNKNPMRNIRFPSSNNPYPNIQRTPYRNLSFKQRYSPNYYNNL